MSNGINRIAHAIAAKLTEINGKIARGVITQAQIDTTHKAFDMDMEEHASFQNIKSLAVANGMLTVEEGQTLYVALGETPSVFNGQDIATKAVLTGIFKELLGARIAERGGKVPTTAKKRRR